MIPYIQKLEFTYFDGELFWDRSGDLARIMGELSSGLRITKSLADQRDLINDEAQLELFYGITAAGITSSKLGDRSFVPTAVKFLGNLARVFELKTLREISFRYVLAQRCASEEEALALYERLCGPELGAKSDWIGWGDRSRARQFEYQLEKSEAILRFAVADLVDDPRTGAANPHVIALVNMRYPLPMAVLAFDTQAFMENVIEIMTKRVEFRLASIQDEPPTSQS